jgi:hypothetical protein
LIRFATTCGKEEAVSHGLSAIDQTNVFFGNLVSLVAVGRRFSDSDFATTHACAQK